ncbi:MAG: heparan-alpha-glucosaminide N-acetyltransferase domain-containing protein [Myxococcota bacterium]|nr:heparan-alpha-glucosaminide N-acetyltransferase domain-containing protein [Myxococcota bacterium]
MAFVDAHRGVAVLLMILWHAVDAWATQAARTGAAWDLLRLLGGLAAPSFLFLAGVAVSLRAAADDRRGRPAVATIRALVLRGLEVGLVGYAMRCPTWLFDRSGVLTPATLAPAILIAAGLTASFVAIRRVERAWREGVGWLVGGLGLVVVGYVWFAAVDVDRAARATRADVLHAIGLSIAILSALVAGARLLHRPWTLLLTALGCTLATPALAEAIPQHWPAPLVGLLVRVPEHTSVPGAPLFPLFPWIAYAMAGAAFGARWATSKDAIGWSTLVPTAALGAAVAALGSEWLEPTRALLAEQPWLVPTVRWAHRVGWTLCLALLSFGALARVRWLATLGRSSLLVYVVHLELTYGSGGQWLTDRLDLPVALLGFAMVTFAMVGLAALRQGPVERWLAARRRAASSA